MRKSTLVFVLIFGLLMSQSGFAGDEIAPQVTKETPNADGSVPKEEESQHIFKFVGGLGVGYNTYNSTVVSISQYSLITKFGMNYRNRKLEKFVFSLGSFFTALPFNSSPIHIGAVSDNATVRYLGVNARVGWDAPWLTGFWKLQLNLGWYYNTTFVTNDYFGYVNANGPQFFPTVEYTLNENSLIGAYFKFSPMSSGFSFLNASKNYEVAVGAYYMLPGLLFGKYKHTINLDFAHLSMKPDAIRSFANSTSLGLGVAF